MRRANFWGGYYYCAEFGAFHGIQYFKGENSPDAWQGNIYGPFKTFGEAKRDALEYFQVDINYTRAAISELRSFKKKDVHNETN